ncbi:MAG: class I SAM-dependent methyltransferase [Spirochaetia bacterium]|nr:class I SAM-dependent methyltransferase [Spirochaetia bacterium]
MDEKKIKQWEETQTQWDDTDFLSKEATALMKRKWRRIEKYVLSVLAREVASKNEFLSMLDIGSGRGEFYRLCEDMVKKYTGIEPSEKMLPNDIIEESFELKRGKGEELSDYCCYDACLLKEVLDHTYDPQGVINNAYKALKPGGIIIITLTNKDAFYKLMFKKWAKQIEVSHRDHLYNFNPAEIKNMLLKSGFKVEKTVSYNYMKFPRKMENFLGSLPEPVIYALMNIYDAVMRLFFPDKGSGFMAVGRRGDK